MKTRMGFVSNSSSSSFCISYKNGSHPRKIVEIDLTKFKDRVIKTVDELNKFILEYSGYNDIEIMLRENSFWKIRYENMISSIHDGNELMICSVSSESEDGLEQHIYNQGIGEVIDCNKLWYY